MSDDAHQVILHAEEAAHLIAAASGLTVDHNVTADTLADWMRVGAKLSDRGVTPEYAEWHLRLPLNPPITAEKLERAENYLRGAKRYEEALAIEHVGDRMRADRDALDRATRRSGELLDVIQRIEDNTMAEAWHHTHNAEAVLQLCKEALAGPD